MKRPKIVRTSLDSSIEALAERIDHKSLATWAADCAHRVLPVFDEQYPKDPRPRLAIEALRTWILTGKFVMADIRKAALASHAAARDVAEDDAARSAARAAGQAVAAAHVPRHAIAAARYAATAVWYASPETDRDAAALKEREWQYRQLDELGAVTE